MKLNNECNLLLATATHLKSVKSIYRCCAFKVMKMNVVEYQAQYCRYTSAICYSRHLVIILSRLSVHWKIASPAHIDTKNRQPLAGHSSMLLLSCTLHIACSCSHLDAIHFSPCWTRSPECKEARSSCPLSALDLHCADLMSRCNMGCYSSTMSLTDRKVYLYPIYLRSVTHRQSGFTMVQHSMAHRCSWCWLAASKL